MAKKSGKKLSALKAGAIGAGIGAVAGAAAVALSDEKTRKNLGKKLAELEERAKDFVENTEETTKTLGTKAKKELAKRVPKRK
jgi:gas vesicle protein